MKKIYISIFDVTTSLNRNFKKILDDESMMS